MSFTGIMPRAQMPTSNGPTIQPSEFTAALEFMRLLQESERHRLLLNYFAFYKGTHYSFLRDLSEPQVIINYCRAFVDKSVSFQFANGFSFQTLDGEDTGPEIDVINEVWDYNQKDALGLKVGTMGAITGDCFVKVTYIPQLDKIALVPLDTQTCFPIWSGDSQSEFSAFKIEYIIYLGAAGDMNQVRLYTEIYRSDGTIEIAIDGRTIDRYPNPFGFIPIVQIKNREEPESYYGRSDLVDIIPLQKIYNEQITKFQDIVNYHAEPITLVYGTKMSNIQRGSRKVWHGIPATARIENLELHTDLGALLNFISSIKEAMHEIFGIPLNALGKEQAISNTSNAALQTQYLPLTDLTNRKRITYGAGMEKLNTYILRIYNDFVQNKKFGIVNPNITIQPNWPSPLPKDLERLISQQFLPLDQLGLLDREDALKQLGYRNAKQMLKKIDNDRIAKAKVDAEITKLGAEAQMEVQVEGQKQIAQNQPQNQSAEKQEGQTPNEGIVT